jgi:glycosyltransferase involved in cell wall biosynthesis
MSDAGEGSGQPNVTVVIPAYRAEATIRRTIDSALAQTGVTVRVVVVIDGKLDRTAEVIADYPPDLVTVIEHETNQGAAISRNRGLDRVESDFVMFLDADDFVEGPLLHGLCTRIRSSQADVGFGPMQVLHEADLGEGPLLRRLLYLRRRSRSGSEPLQASNAKGEFRDPIFVPDFQSPADIFRKWHFEGIFVAPCSVVWRTEFIRLIGGWDPELTRNDDGELVMRAVLKGAKFVLSDEGCGVYVKHTLQSLSTRMDNLDSMLRANEKLLAIASPAIPRAMQLRICAGHYFNIAWQGYYGGRDDVADVALKRSREMGFGTRGRVPHRIAFNLFGLKNTCRFIARIRQSGRSAPAASTEPS